MNEDTLFASYWIILATGFRRSLPFLQDFYSIGGKATPDKDNSPILTDAHDLHSLAWTGHYIPDPTLAFANVRPWTFGRYQSLAFAKVWKGTARLPNKERLWKQYFNDNHWQAPAKVVFGTIAEETLGRQYPLENRERFAYYSDEVWEHGYTSSDNFTRIENTPRDEWPTYPRAGDQSPEYDFDSGWEW
ncbi:uncharacterized protein L199_006865 [Kwoniella botswanensis]|uniref:uncharacterized protein n=1 Tax=Kwoniella botswanensis TaxID=1268659 RepID=UPI00315D5C50